MGGDDGWDDAPPPKFPNFAGGDVVPREDDAGWTDREAAALSRLLADVTGGDELEKCASAGGVDVSAENDDRAGVTCFGVGPAAAAEAEVVLAVPPRLFARGVAFLASTSYTFTAAAAAAFFPRDAFCLRADDFPSSPSSSSVTIH
jgi:hypothetical protein